MKMNNQLTNKINAAINRSISHNEIAKVEWPSDSRSAEETILDADGDFLQDDEGYRRCNCEDYPCCGH